jgi:prephenate dehydratase
LGPEGTYTHEAADSYFENLEPVFCSTITECLEAEAETAIVPIENSLGGGVTETIDMLREKDADVTGEKILDINHCLISKETSIDDVEKAVSHPQALSQCREFIQSRGFEQAESSSTAKAAAELDGGEAAIASETAAKVHGLNILEKSIQDKQSITRFLIINGPEKGEQNKTSLILEPGDDRPGILHSMLGCFAGQQINLSQIESRPTKTGLGEYFFYIEAETDKGEEKFQKAVKCLKTYADVKILGSYRSNQK